MAQPHKGDRKQLIARLPAADWQEISERAQTLGISISQYVADVMSHHVATTEAPGTAGSELITRLEVTQLSKSA